MERILKMGKMTRFHCSNPTAKDLKYIKDTYDLHEIIEEDISEMNTQDKIDVYDNSTFLVLHFPKFNQSTKAYYINEFNIILGKDYIISLTTHATNHIDEIRNDYIQALKTGKEDFKTSPYYILYMLIDVMYDKVLSAISKFKKDLSVIESKVFSEDKIDPSLVKQLSTKKRNVINLKHIMLPQQDILVELGKVLEQKYHGELDVYTEDLEYKHDKIMSNITILNESVDTLFDAYNSIMNMKTNDMISILTIITVIFGIMTFFTGLYGMNVPLPGQNLLNIFYVIIGTMMLVGGGMWFIFRKHWYNK